MKQKINFNKKQKFKGDVFMKNNYEKNKNVNPYPSSNKVYFWFMLSMCNFFFMMAFAISRTPLLLVISIVFFFVALVKLHPFVSLWDNANMQFAENERLRKELELEREKKPLNYSLPNLIVSYFIEQLPKVLKPDDVWQYTSNDVLSEILVGRVHLIVNGKKALIILNKLEIVELVYPPTVLPEKDVSKKEDFTLYAFEWVETNSVEINSRREKAIADESYEFYIPDLLPERKYWDAIVKALIQKGFAPEIIEVDDEEVVKISC